jgi:hypothetical protein
MKGTWKIFTLSTISVRNTYGSFVVFVVDIIVCVMRGALWMVNKSRMNRNHIINLFHVRRMVTDDNNVCLNLHVYASARHILVPAPLSYDTASS